MNYGKRQIRAKQKKMNTNTPKFRNKAGIILFKLMLLTFTSLLLIGAFAGYGAYKGVIDSVPDISNIDVSPKGFSTMIYDSEGNEISKLVSSGSNRIYVPINEIPKNLQYAFVAIEDERFWEHNGIDLKGIARAAAIGVTSGRFSEGASTITQQLLKNNVFSNWTQENSFAESLERKIQEQYLALELEKTMSKDIILENYLNTINLGQNTLGVQAASKRYFNKDVSELTISESAVIAGITQNPSRYNPVSYPENNAKRREKVLGNMLEQGYISKSQYQEALADDVYARIQVINTQTSSSSIYTYFIDELTEQVMQDLQDQKGYTQTQAYNALYSGGLSIYTTQDASIQQICNEEFANTANYPAGTEVSLTYRLTVQKENGTLENYNEQTMLDYFQKTDGIEYSLNFVDETAAYNDIERYKTAIIGPNDKIVTDGEVISLTPEPQASIVVIDQYTGQVKAIVGGRGEKKASLTLNRATNTKRQPGSTFKVLSTFAPAIDSAGMTLATVQDDAPYNYSNGRPVNNYYQGYDGLSTIRAAITKSMNIVAVKTLTDITPQLGYDYLLNFGFTTLDGSLSTDITQALALGGIRNGVTNLELTAAYATIANSGTYTKPTFYSKIVDHSGEVLIDNTPQTKSVLKQTTAWLLTNAMEDVVKTGTATSVALDNMPVAGKTGTTSSYNDVWFSGYTPYYTCSVWGGYDNNANLPSGSRDYHKTLWKNIMARIHQNLETKEFTMPEGIVTANICKKSGKLAVKGLCDNDPRGSMIVTEFFAEGSVPTEVCDCHISAITCSASGLLAGDLCPETSRVNSVYIVRPEGSIGTTADSPYTMPAGLSNSTCNVHTEEALKKAAEEAAKKKAAEEAAKKKAAEKKNKNTTNSKTNQKNN